MARTVQSTAKIRFPGAGTVNARGLVALLYQCYGPGTEKTNRLGLRKLFGPSAYWKNWRRRGRRTPNSHPGNFKTLPSDHFRSNSSSVSHFCTAFSRADRHAFAGSPLPCRPPRLPGSFSWRRMSWPPNSFSITANKPLPPHVRFQG